MMKTRGRILRQPGPGPGIVMIEGQQFRFQLEGVWRSEIAPRTGQPVLVELDRELQVIGLSVITEPAAMNRATSPASEAVREAPSRTGILGKLYGKLLGAIVGGK